MYVQKSTDKILILIVATLTIVGFLVFISASMGLAERQEINIYKFIANQLFFGVICGSIGASIIAIAKNLNWLKKYSAWIFGGAIILTLMVFVPVIGGYHGGAQRWLYFGPLSLQPAEILKISFVIYWAAYLAKFKDSISDLKGGALPFIIITGIACGVLALQPDLDGAVTIAAASFIMYFVAGARWKHILIMFLLGILSLGIIISTLPYAQQRIKTFISPNSDPQGSGYQIQQSLIAVGSGGVIGKGFGQSLQKFKYLPESNSDAIFSVIAEEFGFVGALIIIGLFFSLFIRCFQIAGKISDAFSSVLIVGLVTLIITQSFINIASMIGLMPLSGLPLAFFSKGGTSLFFILLSCGIIINVSKFSRK
ncbi:MAG: putative peptidoglycan glycosyltransferase FtsW [bacterium]